MASILNLLHNCNVTKESNLTETKDWLPRPIDERIREEQIEKEGEEERTENGIVDRSGWDEMKNRLIASGKPIQTTFKL